MDDENFIPNEETLSAMNEAEDIASGKSYAKIYRNFDELWSDICETKDS